MIASDKITIPERSCLPPHMIDAQIVADSLKYQAKDVVQHNSAPPLEAYASRSGRRSHVRKRGIVFRQLTDWRAVRQECSMPLSSYLKAVRAKVGHDLLTMAAASISIFDSSGRLLLGEDAETGLWTLPGGAIDPNEHPADAAVRECFEEPGLVKPERIVGVFGGPEFLIRYPNGDVTYYTTVAFEASIVDGSLKADGHEIAQLRYFTQTECSALTLSPSSRVRSQHGFSEDRLPYFAPARWLPGND
jgi:8-oxo-dGTP pyrophosphatase MutT (NUDIX family)